MKRTRVPSIRRCYKPVSGRIICPMAKQNEHAIVDRRTAICICRIQKSQAVYILHNCKKASSHVHRKKHRQQNCRFCSIDTVIYRSIFLYYVKWTLLTDSGHASLMGLDLFYCILMFFNIFILWHCVGKRVTIVIDDDIHDKLRKLQAKMIQNSNKSVSFSRIINEQASKTIWKE